MSTIDAKAYAKPSTPTASAKVQKRLAAIPAMRRQKREREMRSRTRDRTDDEARHQPDARNQPGCHEGAAERDPEAEHLGHCRDVGIGESLVLEQRHRHRARDVARHAEARDEQQDRRPPSGRAA